MSQSCERVYRNQEDIARLEALIEALPSNARVRITLLGGGKVDAIVAERPVLQVFVGSDGQEGSNALVRLETMHSDEAQLMGDLWIDSIHRVEALPESGAADRDIPEASVR